MTDDASDFYNAWMSVMPAPEHRLLCIWRMDRNWETVIPKSARHNGKSIHLQKNYVTFWRFKRKSNLLNTGHIKLINE